jgi:hypothetical protein
VKASNIFAFTLGAAVCISLYACGGGSSGGGSSSMTTAPVTPPSQPQPTTYSVNDVLTMAKMTSETSDPTSVEGAMVSPASDETSDPMSVD